MPRVCQWTGPRTTGSVGRRLGQRKPDLEPGVPRLGEDLDVAAVAVDHDPVGDVQAQAGTLADRLGGEERLEDPRPDLLRDTRPAVADLDQDAVVLPRGAQGERALPAHRLYRVVDQVRPDLVQLRR